MNGRKPIWQTLLITLVLIFAPMKGLFASMVHTAEEPVALSSVKEHCHMSDEIDAVDHEMTSSNPSGDHHAKHDCCDAAGSCCVLITPFSQESVVLKSVWHALLPRHDSQFIPTPAYKPPKQIAA